jgi:nitric oxide reductase NorQ protein
MPCKYSQIRLEDKMAVAERTTEDTLTVLSLQPHPDFIETTIIQGITKRAMGYLQAGFPVHFRGPAGTGKTTLALHVAAQLGRPVMFIAGDEEFGTSDLIGGQFGYRYRKVVDRFIHSVLKYEEDASQRWVDNRLTTACREGFTLVYDEFTRSRPEANNVLLGVLEEGLLVLPTTGNREAYVQVHPKFRAIFTSNPQEYAGVHEGQDALYDRLLTLDLDYYDRETEIAITASRADISLDQAAPIVDLVRDYRASGEYDQSPTLRACIIIGKVTGMQKMSPDLHDPRFIQVCLDVLESKTAFTSKARDRRLSQRKMIMSLIEHHCRGAQSRARRSPVSALPLGTEPVWPQADVPYTTSNEEAVQSGRASVDASHEQPKTERDTCEEQGDAKPGHASDAAKSCAADFTGGNGRQAGAAGDGEGTPGE